MRPGTGFDAVERCAPRAHQPDRAEADMGDREPVEAGRQFAATDNWLDGLTGGVSGQVKAAK